MARGNQGEKEVDGATPGEAGGTAGGHATGERAAGERRKDEPCSSDQPAKHAFPARRVERWPVALAGVAMQLVLGTVYAWSVFKAPFLASHGVTDADPDGWTAKQFTLAFTLMIGFLGLSAALGGSLVDRAGTRKVALVAAFLFPLATAMAGLAHALDSRWILWIGYGVIGGIGNGLGYITPIAVLVRWFPDRRGFITGLAVMGFGFGAAIMGQVAPRLLPLAGIAPFFLGSAVLFLGVMIAAALFLKNPPEGWKPPVKAWAKGTGKSAEKGNGKAETIESVNLGSAVKTWQFYILWAVLFLNITAGIALISNHAPFARSQTGIGTDGAGTIVALGALFNGLGRIFWSSVSDKLGRKVVFALILGSQVPVFIFLPMVHGTVLLTILCCYILACYGGGFSTMPAYVADTFGPGNMGSIYGKVLLAWSAAGVVGPMCMEFLSSSGGSGASGGGADYSLPLRFAAGALVLGFVLNLIYRRPEQHGQERGE